jgi:MFS family permease
MSEPALRLPQQLEGPMTDEAAIVEPGRTSALAALAYRDFRLFWFGLVVANVGTWMQMFGQGYLVVQLAIRDGVPQLAPLYLGLVGLARALPSLALGLFGGAVADRSDRRRLLMVTQLLAALNAAALGLLTITDHIHIVEVLLLGALNSTIFAFDAPTRQSMVPRLVDKQHLMSAIGLNAAAYNGAQIIGPVVGGILYLPLGVGGLFLLNSLSYFAVIIALFRMSPVPTLIDRREQTVFESIREGLSYVRHDPVTRWVIILSAVSALLSRPYLQLLPAFAVDTLGLGAVELSWMLGASGAGALLGALATASLGDLRRRGLLLLGGATVMGVLVAAFSYQRSLGPALPLLAGASLAMMLFMGMCNTLLQTRAPDALRGRVMSVQTMVFLGLVPLGTMLLGTLGTLIGVDGALRWGSLLFLAAVAYAALRVRPLRQARAD